MLPVLPQRRDARPGLWFRPLPAFQARPSRSRPGGGIALLLIFALLGFLLVVQLRTAWTLGSDLRLRSVDELARLVGTLSQEVDRLQEEVARLRVQAVGIQYALRSDQAALAQEQQTLEELGLIVGSLPARGDGIRVEIADTEHRLTTYELCLAVNELRSAGAEAIVLNGLRVDVDSFFGGVPGRLTLNGLSVRFPLVLEAVGNVDALYSALKVPGGLVSTLAQLPGVSASVVKAADLHVPARAGGPRVFTYATPTQ